MGLVSWSWDIEIRPVGDGRWRLAIVSRERRELGPFGSELEARLVEHRLLGRWRVRAAQLGGVVQRTHADRWVASLPAGVSVRAGRPLADVAVACTTQGASASPRR